MFDEQILKLKESLRNFNDNHKTQIEKICTEIEFASKFIELYPGKQPRWGKLIEKAIDIINKSANNKRARLGKAIQQAEEILSPIGKQAKKYNIHCIGHAHIDMNWMWTWQETVSITIDTFRTVLKLMEEFPEFCFTQSQASVYAIVKEFDPELLEQIKEKVKQGRWEITACQWVEGDKNLASGESLIRHLLYTRKFIEQEFGLSPDDVSVEWEPDTFGHAATIPSIVSRGGVKYYYMCRGGTFDKPPIFRWQSPDGRSVLVNLEQTWYNDSIGTHNAPAMIEFCKKTEMKDWLCVFGVGDHGGGPTRKDLSKIIEMNSWPIYPNFVFNPAKKFFEIAEKTHKNIPVITGELNFEFTGCYTSQSRIKHANRTAENHMEQAENFCSLANKLVGFPYPNDKIKQGWINTLFGHFHDILPGSGIRETREYQLGLFQQTMAYATQTKLSALRKITEKIDTTLKGKIQPKNDNLLCFGAGVGKGIESFSLPKISTAKALPSAFVIFNPSAYKRSDTIKLTLWDVEEENEEKSFVAIMPNGQIISTQRITKGTYWSHRYVEIAIPVSLDAFGYQTIVIDEGISQPASSQIKTHWKFSVVRQLNIGEYKIENEFVSITIDKTSSGIVSLIDKSTGIDFASENQPIGMLEFITERPRNMSSWVIAEPMKINPIEILYVTPKYQGEYSSAIEVSVKFGKSKAKIIYSLASNKKWVDIEIDVDWFEIGNEQSGTPALRMKFPFEIQNPAGRYEIPFGSIVREMTNGQEVPALKWVDVFDKRKSIGCLVLNDCKYGYNLQDSTLYANLLRSSFEPDILPEGGNYKIKFGIMPHGKKIPVANMIKAGMSFNHSFAVISSDIHPGTFVPTSKDIISVEPDNIIISNIKKCEDSNSIIIKLFETSGKTTLAKIKINKNLIGKLTCVKEIDWLENELENSSAKLIANGFSIKLAPYEIAAIKLEF